MTTDRAEWRDRIAEALVRASSNGICPLDGPCGMCDCFDPQHRGERMLADAVMAAVVGPLLAEVEALSYEATKCFRLDHEDRMRHAEADNDALRARLDAVRDYIVILFKSPGVIPAVDVAWTLRRALTAQRRSRRDRGGVMDWLRDAFRRARERAETLPAWAQAQVINTPGLPDGYEPPSASLEPPTSFPDQEPKPISNEAAIPMSDLDAVRARLDELSYFDIGSRTALIAAVRAVLAEHTPTRGGQCESDGLTYPCQTLRAVIDALTPDHDAGDEE